MTWGEQRQTYIISGIAFLIIIPVVIYLAISLYEKPTCFDGRQNGTEAGVDCGGTCQLVCRNSTVSINTIWDRVFFDESENVVGSALLENKNTRAIAVDVPYKFSIYTGSIELDSIEGVVTVQPKKRVPLIISGLDRGVQDVDYHKFEVGEPREWIYEQGEESPFLISREQMNEDIDNPRISAVVKNITFDERVNDSYFVVFVYDEYDSVVTQSTTYIKKLDPQESKEIFFTWNSRFEREVLRFDIIELNR